MPKPNDSKENSRNDPHQKALQINLDATRYGTFAEIGAGQEVASWFFHVGASSGTVAKSMSAYDMTVSDSIYGKSGRYVSKERVVAMLDHEYSLLIERLAASRGETTRFFAFADTVSARNYAGTNESHGWMGIRFQHAVKAEPSQLIIHVNMNDSENKRQQDALGILGVNFTHGAFYLHESIQDLLAGLLDSLGPARIEVDYIEASGPCFAGLDHRTLTIMLLRQGLASAILFDSKQTPLPPTEFFHKKPILLERGSFRALHHVYPNLVSTCKEQLREIGGKDEREAAYVLEMTLNNILRAKQSDDNEVLTVVSQLCDRGHNVLVSNYSEFFHLTQYLRRFSQSPIGFVVSAALLPLLLEDDRYALLKGGVLEASARLFQQQVYLLVYPVESSLLSSYLSMIKFDISQLSFPSTGLVKASSLSMKNVNEYLHRYLVESGIVRDVPVEESKEVAP
jgi:hypothetical protein